MFDPRIRGEKQSDQEIELQTLKKSKVVNRTGQEPSLADKVPEQQLYDSDAIFWHTVSWAFDEGRIGDVISLILARYFGEKAPVLILTEKEKQRLAHRLQLLSVAGKTIQDAEVQGLLKPLFPDARYLKAQWSAIQKRPVNEIREFIHLIEKHYAEAQTLNVGTINLVDQAKEAFLGNLNLIRKEIAQYLADQALEKFKADKLYAYLNLYATLGRIEGFHEIKQQVQQALLDRIEIIKNTISNPPSVQLEDLAKQAGIELPKGNFDQRARSLKKQLEDKKANTAQNKNQLFAKNTLLESNAKQLSERKRVLEQEPKRLLEEKERSEKQAKERITEHAKKVKERYPLFIQQLEGQISELTDAQEIAVLQRDILRFKSELTNIGSTSRKEEQEALQEINKNYQINLKRNEEAMKSLKKEIRANRKAQQQVLGDASLAMQRENELQGLENQFQTIMRETFENPQMVENCKHLVRLLLTQSALDAIPTKDNWLYAHYSKQRNSFDGQLTAQLTELGVPAGSSSYREAQQEIGRFALAFTADQ